jgi:NAD(P)-dependent dehydrogenase (short-subunit alcohol dehydrogenase family)/acyl carrier protein
MHLDASRDQSPVGDRVGAIRSRCIDATSADELYTDLKKVGFRYGPTFCGVERLWSGDGEALGRIVVPAALTDFATYRAHPGLLDACLHVLSGAVRRRASSVASDSFYVASIGAFRQYRALAPCVWSHARVSGSVSIGFEGDVDVLDSEGNCLAELRGVRVQRARAKVDDRRLKQLADLQYELSWVPVDEPSIAAVPSGDATYDVVLADDLGFGDALMQRLESAGRQCVRVRAGTTFQSLAFRDFRVDPYDVDSYRRLLAAMRETGRVVGQIIYMFPLSSVEKAAELHARDVHHVLEHRCRPLFSLAQALELIDEPLQLRVVTANAQPVTGFRGALSAASAALWGMIRSFRAETRGVHCQLIDLDATSPAEAERVANEVSASIDEEEVAYRGGRRFAPRLLRRSQPAGDGGASPFRRDACYVVTGGLGALGLEVAQRFASGGAGHLLLIGRRPPSEQAAARIADMESCGARVHVTQADVTNLESLSRVFASAPATVRGIVHAAGAIDDGLLRDQSWDAFWKVMAPKALGIGNLQECARELRLDFFAAFSSIAAVLPSPGQANYAAGNAFMDAVVHCMRMREQRALTLNWGPVAEAGMAASLQAQHRTRLEQRGLRLIDPTDGLGLLCELLATDASQVILLSARWPQVFAGLGSQPPARVFDSLRELERDEDYGGRRPAQIAAKLRACNENDAAELVIAYLHGMAQRILGLSAGEIPVDQPLESLGLDSVMSIEFSRALSSEFGVDLPVARFLEGISIAELQSVVRQAVVT